MTGSVGPYDHGFGPLIGREPDRPDAPLCGAQPDLPRPLAWHPCNIARHSFLDDHVTYQDGVKITWNEATVMVVKRMLHLDGE